MNFTKAAEKLYVSQQIVSKQIKILEEELGFDLFIRNTKSVILTTSGRYMYEFLTKQEKEQNDAINDDDGSFTPERAGAIPMTAFLNKILNEGLDKKTILNMLKTKRWSYFTFKKN